MHPLNHKHMGSGVTGKPELSIVRHCANDLRKACSVGIRTMDSSWLSFQQHHQFLKGLIAASTEPTAFFSGQIFDVVGQFKFKTFVADADVDADVDVDVVPTRKVPTLVR